MPVGPPQDVFQASAGGGGGAGVSSLNLETGPLTITGSGGIAITTPTTTTINVDGSAIVGGVSSVNTLTGALTLAAGTNVTITPSGGNTLTIDSAAAGGVTSLNTATGAVTLVAGTNVTIGQVGANITIAAATASGVSSLNTLTGALSITSPDNFVSISNSGSSVRISAGTGSYVTLSTDQTGISGNKQWIGAITFGNGIAASATQKFDSSNPVDFTGRIQSDVASAIITTKYLRGTVGSIHGATNATPIVITYTQNSSVISPIQTGDGVIITDVLGNTAANGNWIVTVSDATHFSLNGSTGNGAYTSGGNVFWDTSDNPEDSQATNAIRILDSPFGFQPTSGIYFDTVGSGNRSGIIFGTGSIKTTGYGIDFKNLATTVPIRIGNATQIVGRDIGDSADIPVVGINSSDHPTVGIFQFPVADGTSGQALVTDGAGTLSFSSVAPGVNSIRFTNTFPDTLDNSDYTVLADTSGGDGTVNLASAPVDGQMCNIKKVAAGNTLTIGRNGNSIDGAASDLTVTTNMENLQFQFSSTFGWAIL